MKPTRAVIYARISDDSEGRNAGVGRQVEDCASLADRLGWELEPEALPALIDNDISASTRSKARRPAFDELVEGVRTKRFDGILYYSNSRLTRRPREYETIIELVEQTGVKLASVVSGNADLTTADGRMIGRMLAAQDAAEAERIGERVQRAFRQRRESGLPNPSRRAFGFKPGGVEVEPAEAEAIREAAAMLIGGASIGEIARYWNATGVKPVQANTWIAATVRTVLIKPRVAGLIESEGQVLGEGNFEAILDRFTYERMVAAMADRSSHQHATYRGRVHLLSGLLWCSLCGRPVKVNALRDEDGELRRDSYVVCARSQRGCGRVKRNLLTLQEYVYAVVEEALVEQAKAGDELADGSNADDLERLEAERAAVEKDIGDLREAMKARTLVAADFLPAVQALREVADELDAQIRSFTIKREAVDPEDALLLWRNGAFDDRRRVIEQTVESIVLRPVGKVGPKAARLAVPDTTEVNLL